MSVEKPNWKLFIANPERVVPGDFFKVFNTWIPNSPEIFVDVADYSHVHDGPLTLLVGHYVDYALDATGRRLGLLYNRKRNAERQAPIDLKTSLRETLAAAKRLLDDPTLKGKLAFKSDELLFMVNDRALAPNTAETFARIKLELDAVCTSLYGKGAYTLEQKKDPKQRFQVLIKNTTQQSIEGWLTTLK